VTSGLSQQSKGGWKDGLLACGGFLFLLVSLFIPVLQFVALWLLPLPFLLLKAKRPWSTTLIPFGMLIVWLLFYPVPLFICLFLFAWLTGSVMGHLVRKEDATGTDAVLGGLVAGLVSSWIILLVGQLGFQLFSRLTTVWDQQWAETVRLMGKNGIALQDAGLSLSVAFPILLFMLIVPSVVATFLVASRLLERAGFPRKSLPPFYEWRLPRIFFTAYLLLMIASLVQSGSEVGGDWLLGFLYLMQILMVLQGCSFALFLLQRRRGRVGWGSHALALVLAVPLSPLFMLLGFIDTGIDLRGRLAKK
jgi:uncharacterized protein YybS (DUF2232 family)